MRIPVLRGVIDRRVLANYRLAPEAVQRLLPSPLEPKLIDGHAIGGVCLIRFSKLRPRAMPGTCGFASENGAHRFAVQWQENGQQREGVYIARRDTGSRLNHLAGGRLFPGVQHFAKFESAEQGDDISIAMTSTHDRLHLRIEGRVTENWPRESVFNSAEQASAFFESGSLGFSPGRHDGQLDAMELRCHDWRVETLDVRHVESSFFDDAERFPPGSGAFDHALLMRQIDHEWHSREPLCCGVGA